MYTPGNRTPGRRLSVPSSGGIPFQSPHGGPLGRPLFGPGAHNSSHMAAFSPSSSTMASPTASAFSRRDSMSSNADEAWRRRTWHPDSNNFQNSSATNPSSRLSNVMTPSQAQTPVSGPPPIAAPAASQNYGVRLPGIESFDPIPHRPVSPPRGDHSPMMVDTAGSHPVTMLPPADSLADERRDTVSWDMGLHRGLTRLDITQNRHTPPRDGASSWARDTNMAMVAEAERARAYVSSARPGEHIAVNSPPMMNGPPSRAYHQHTVSAPAFASTREKRRGWYNGPAGGHSEEPAGKVARVERMVHPNVHAFSGFPAREAPPPPATIPEDAAERDNMLRLQALVAVATGEGNATAAY